MRKIRNFLSTLLGLMFLALLALILAALFQGQQAVDPVARPLAGVTPTPIPPTLLLPVTQQPRFKEITPPPAPTPTSTPLFPYKVQVPRRYPLQAEGQLLGSDSWSKYKVPLFSPDGNLLLVRKPAPVKVKRGSDCRGWACRLDLHELWRTDAAGKSPQLLAEEVGNEAWSPDSQWIAYTQHNPSGPSSLWIIRPDGSDKRMVADNLASTYLEWAGKSIIFYNGEGSLVTSMNLEDGSIHQLKPSASSIDRFAVSPKNDRAIFSVGPEVWLTPLDTLKPITVTPYYGAFSGIRGGIAWSPDGSKAAYASRSSVYLVDKDGENITEVILFHNSYLTVTRRNA